MAPFRVRRVLSEAGREWLAANSVLEFARRYAKRVFRTPAEDLGKKKSLQKRVFISDEKGLSRVQSISWSRCCKVASECGKEPPGTGRDRVSMYADRPSYLRL